VERAFRSPDAPAAEGWEAAAATRERARAALAAAPAGRDVVLVGHGTAWTLLVAAITGDPPDIVAWRRMTLPDHCLLDGERMVSPWGAWRRLSSA
jgi:broad specificity phosphatase PhoE